MLFEIDDQPYERWLWDFRNSSTNQEGMIPSYLTEREAKMLVRIHLIEVLDKIEDSRIMIKKEEEWFGIDYPLRNIQLELF